MTAEDKKKLIQACKLVKEVFPNMCGNINWNLHPERQKVNINVSYSLMIDPDEYFEAENLICGDISMVEGRRNVTPAVDR